NILATERLDANKGTALASLSLFRQIGMTIAPTIYAGFIARGFNNIGNVFRTDFQPVLQENLAEAGLSAEALPALADMGGHAGGGSAAMDPAQLGEMAGAIPDPALRDVVLDSVAEMTRRAAENGY